MQALARQRRNGSVAARLAAAWTALLTALVCALLPLGASAARTTGSAFDPTNSIVTVSPRRQLLKTDVQPVLRRGTPDDGMFRDARDLPQSYESRLPAAMARFACQDAPAGFALRAGMRAQPVALPGGIGPRAPPLPA